MIEIVGLVGELREEAERVLKEFYCWQLIKLLNQGILSPESKNEGL